MFSVSSTGYYNWLAAYEDRSGKCRQSEAESFMIKGHMRKIIKNLGFVPGKRDFRLRLWRDYGIQMSKEDKQADESHDANRKQAEEGCI